MSKNNPIKAKQDPNAVHRTHAPRDHHGSGDDDKRLLTAEACFEALRARLDADGIEGVDNPRIDLQAAAVQALSVANALAEPGVRKTIAAIASTGAIDLALIDDLEQVAWAAWFARHKAQQTSITYTEATLPAAIVADASEVRARMLKTLSYNLEEDTEAMAAIAKIRAGSGHLDLADDLAACASMYRRYHAGIRADPKNFRATDVVDAERLSERILRLLGAAPVQEHSVWTRYAARAAKMLFAHYQEAIRVGRFLWHKDDPEGRFPRLHSAVRAAPQRGNKVEGEDGKKRTEPARSEEPEAASKAVGEGKEESQKPEAA
jgi:hypothetical protein